ncbi:PAP2 domain-containing protein [Tirmania nivea]|nr:PAP2 domain-containing protein [Tirmania nivea]
MKEFSASNRMKQLWRKSYAPDWLGLLLISIGYLLLLTAEPFHRLFSLDDRRIQYPFAETERVPLPMLFVYSLTLPVVIITTVALTSGDKRKKKWHQFHVSILGLLLALQFTSFFTDLVKNGVGRPRPDLIARCKPKEGTPEHELVSYLVCTEKDHHTLHDGFRSFPSGHSSFSFAGLGYLSLFLWGQMHALRKGSDVVRILIGLLPTLGALAIVVTRTEDYRHDVYDVTTGSIIGGMVAFYSYRRYFPPLTSPDADIAYTSRIHGETPEEGFEALDSPDLELGNVPPFG